MPNSFISAKRSVIALDLDKTKEDVLQHLQISFGAGLTQLALGRARQNFIAAEQRLAEQLKQAHGRTPSREDREKMERSLNDYISQLHTYLATTRRRKWEQNGVKPKPLPRHNFYPGAHHTRSVRKTTPHPNTSNIKPAMGSTVINISSQKLVEAELSLLRRGLTFCRTTSSLNKIHL